MLQGAFICAAILVCVNVAVGLEVTFATPDGGVVHADLYGESGRHGIVLAHGGLADKGDWAPQAEQLAAAGYLVLAIDFRGYGDSRGGGMSRSLYLGGRYFDVLGGIQYLLSQEVQIVSVIGSRMGAAVVAYATTKVDDPAAIGSVILLAPPPLLNPEDVPGKKLVLVSLPDRLEESIRRQFAEFPSPKKLVVIDPPNPDPAVQSRETQVLEEILSCLASADPSATP